MIRTGIFLSAVFVVSLLTGSPANAAAAFLLAQPLGGAPSGEGA